MIMKFDKSDIIKMGGTAVITAGIFFFIFVKLSSSFVSGSEMISWNTAKKYQGDYLSDDNPHPLRTLYKEGDKENFEKLKGFKISADQLNDIIYHNTSLRFWEKADEVVFYFGMEGLIADPNNPSDEHANMKLIAAGVRKGELLIPSEPDQQATIKFCSIADKADPCPPCEIKIR